MRRDQRNAHHLATISHDGRFWDAYLELVETHGAGQPARGRIAFSAADAGETEPVRTATIFVEDTPQEVVARAREFKTHQLVALLRSAVDPDTADDSRSEAGDTGPAAGGASEPGADGERSSDPPGTSADAQGDAEGRP